MIILELANQVLPRVGKPILGLIIPGLVFLISFLLTYLLYQHFVKELHKGKK